MSIEKVNQYVFWDNEANQFCLSHIGRILLEDRSVFCWLEADGDDFFVLRANNADLCTFKYRSEDDCNTHFDQEMTRLLARHFQKGIGYNAKEMLLRHNSSN